MTDTLTTVPAGMIALNDWARKYNLSRNLVNAIIEAGQITPTTVELQGYPVRHIHADTRLPRQKKTTRREPEQLPDGMIYLTEWARMHRLTSKRIEKLVYRGRIPVSRSERGRLIICATTEVRKKIISHPNPEMLSLHQWAELNGLIKACAESMVRSQRINVERHGGRIYVHRDTPRPGDGNTTKPHPNPEMLSLSQWAELNGLTKTYAESIVGRQRINVERLSGRIYVHRDTPRPDDRRITKPHPNPEMLLLTEWARLRGLTRANAYNLIHGGGLTVERLNGCFYVHRDTPRPPRKKRGATK